VKQKTQARVLKLNFCQVKATKQVPILLENTAISKLKNLKYFAATNATLSG